MTTGLSDFSFGSSVWIWGLLGLPVLAGLFFWAELRARRRLESFIQAPRLRGQLTGATSTARRRWRYALLLAGLASLILAMAEPRKGYEVRETHRRGLDLIVIVDVSKSMLATDVPPDRLQRAKLAVHDLVGELGGDRLGLVAFAGSAFLQAPLTVDYDAVLDATAELNTDLIPLGGTNIGAAIDLALEAFGKSDTGSRAILLLSDGEPTSDTEQASGVQAAGRAAAAGVKIFTIGIGTPEGSLIPLNSNGTEFVRDQGDKIVRSRLDENNLRDISSAANGFYLRFASGLTTMRSLEAQGLSQMKAKDMDVRLERRPLERYQWPLGLGLILLGSAALMGERRKTTMPNVTASAVRTGVMSSGVSALPNSKMAASAALAVWFGLLSTVVIAEEPPNNPPTTSTDNALELYRGGRYDEAYRAFEQLAKKNPGLGSLQFNAGASAYMGKQYDEALDAFGRALTTDDADLQAKSHYNFGNTLFRRGEEQKDRELKLKDWKNAIQHYDRTLEMLKAGGRDNPLTGNTSYNRDLVQKRLDEETKQPTPPPQPQPQKKDQKDQKRGQQKQSHDQSQQGSAENEGQDQQQDGQSKQNGPPSSQDQTSQQGASGKSQPQNADANHPPKNGDQPSPRDQPPDSSSLPKQDEPRPHGDFQSQTANAPTPSGEATPAKDDANKEASDVREGAGKELPEATEEAGKMSPTQARALLDSLKGEDDHVVLNGKPDNPRKHDEPVVKDW